SWPTAADRRFPQNPVANLHGIFIPVDLRFLCTLKILFPPHEGELWRSTNLNTSGSTANNPSRSCAAKQRSRSFLRRRRLPTCPFGVLTAARPCRPRGKVLIAF